MGDVISVRARKEGDKICYAVVDEYDEQDENGEVIPRYSCEPTESEGLLGPEGIRELLWSIHCDGYGQIFTTAWEEQLEGPIEDYENDFYFLDSDFYSGLQGWLEDQFQVWKRTRI